MGVFMFVLNKKRIYIVLLSLLMSTLIFQVNKPIEKMGETVETVALPVNNKVIILDSGHGYPDEGAFLLHKENKQLTFYK